MLILHQVNELIINHLEKVFSRYPVRFINMAKQTGNCGCATTGILLHLHGYYKNEVPANWKMYHENLKDPYHAPLLHSFLVVFGLMVAGNESAMIADGKYGIHGTMASAKKEDKYAKVSDDTKKEMRSFHEGMKLQDERFLEYIKEFDSPWSVTMQTIWPNLIVQREMNTLGVRHIALSLSHSHAYAVAFVVVERTS